MPASPTRVNAAVSYLSLLETGNLNEAKQLAQVCAQLAARARASGVTAQTMLAGAVGTRCR